jgi:hypothetical protein
LRIGNQRLPDRWSNIALDESRQGLQDDILQFT